MYQIIISYILYALGIYAAVGLLYAIPFAFKRVNRIDPDARDAGRLFRLLIVPGTIVFWPVLMRRDFGGQTRPSDEKTAHKNLAS